MERNYNAVLGDNNAGAGRVSTKRITVKLAHTGPFKVTRPLRDDVLLGNENYTVRWIGRETAFAPIRSKEVDILLSTDGGAFFEKIVSKTNNGGWEELNLPNENSQLAMIIVRCSDNIFSSVSKQFKIERQEPL